jgi:hypothetical protein
MDTITILLLLAVSNLILGGILWRESCLKRQKQDKHIKVAQ